MNILLDTCCLLWLANEDAQLSEKASKAIDEAHFTFVSPVSAWEIGLKESKGKLRFNDPLPLWWRKVMETHDLTELPLRGEEAVHSASLPLLHRDPADRLLISVAIKHNMTLLTPDDKISQYPGVKTLW